MKKRNSYKDVKIVHKYKNDDKKASLLEINARENCQIVVHKDNT